MAHTELAPAIVSRAKDGDGEAFRLIFNRYGRPVLGFIYDQVHSRELAEELTQETFVRAWRNLGGLREETHLSTWLFGIARNVVRESARHARRDARKIGLDEPESQNLRADTVLPDGAMIDRELNTRIRTAMESLDTDKRLVFSLKILHEKSYEEISEITGFSISKLKTDLHRARAEMRRRIGPYLGSLSE
ncbi:MAG: RNA polymerase sigma factor [Blastocatellia bacterium]